MAQSDSPEGLTRRVTRLEGKTDEMRHFFRAAREDVAALNSRFDRVEQVVLDQQEMLDAIAATQGRHTEAIGGLTQTVDGLTQTVDGLTQNVDGLTQTVDQLTRTVGSHTGLLEEILRRLPSAD